MEAGCESEGSGSESSWSSEEDGSSEEEYCAVRLTDDVIVNVLNKTQRASCPGSLADQIQVQHATLMAMTAVGQESVSFRERCLSKVEAISWVLITAGGFNDLTAHLDQLSLSGPLKSLSLSVQEPLDLREFWKQREAGLQDQEGTGLRDQAEGGPRNQEEVGLRGQREAGLGVAANFYKLEHLALSLGTPSASERVLSALTLCSGLTSLSIDCTWEGYADLQGQMGAWLGIAANCPKLEHLALSLGTHSASEPVLPMLAACSGLKSLSLECAWVVKARSPLVSTYLDAPWAELLVNLTGLQRLQLTGCSIVALPSLPELTHLSLSLCAGFEGFPELPKLKHLKLRECHDWELREPVFKLLPRLQCKIEECDWQCVESNECRGEPTFEVDYTARKQCTGKKLLCPSGSDKSEDLVVIDGVLVGQRVGEGIANASQDDTDVEDSEAEAEAEARAEEEYKFMSRCYNERIRSSSARSTGDLRHLPDFGMADAYPSLQGREAIDEYLSSVMNQHF
ncbi:hypothetical protein KFL_002960080 [Klebsormidium nitens]|uniref:Uncharacterized protein n=1 Tax=Klebsormidium nitens TaxID=105231 RepID=A0A1Y1I7P0_KLENI|nr:hypothetical protein KFL_002960080 [Klebsormidium nitens]|eukprot:GAQ86553.1 hypothetical protein KFL_002960080 [Klebsormidium nitens]